MADVRAKKHLGQHFLKDKNIAAKIVESLVFHNGYSTLIEIGPGTGVLTDFILKKKLADYRVVEIDRESVDYLEKHYPGLKIISGDYLRMKPEQISGSQYGIIGNFPYNISSQIFFRVLEDRNRVEEVVCMLQREVAQRIASPPGNKDYGILSVLLQAFYNIKYLFTVDEHVFNPPPRVKSGVIRLVRNETRDLNCNEKLFFSVVKQGFNNRRKTLRNALKPLNLPAEMNQDPVLDKRAEQLGVTDFVNLTRRIQDLQTP
jgi:16S rRNA (adenine1518-N6/adenine1519-N6)-dimethyltransferase